VLGTMAWDYQEPHALFAQETFKLSVGLVRKVAGRLNISSFEKSQNNLAREDHHKI